MQLTNDGTLLYLGRDINSGAFYFLGSKNGIGRFLKYQAYPMWCSVTDVGNFIDLSAPLTEEMMTEVQLFVNGRVEYEIKPKIRGRAEKVIRHEIQEIQVVEIKTEVVAESSQPISRTAVSARKTDKTRDEEKRYGKSRTQEGKRGRTGSRDANSGGNRIPGSDIQPTVATPVTRSGRRLSTVTDVLVSPGEQPKRRRRAAAMPVVK